MGFERKYGILEQFGTGNVSLARDVTVPGSKQRREFRDATSMAKHAVAMRQAAGVTGGPDALRMFAIDDKGMRQPLNPAERAEAMVVMNPEKTRKGCAMSFTP